MPKAYGGVPSSLKLPAGYGPAPVTGITRNFRIGDDPPASAEKSRFCKRNKRVLCVVKRSSKLDRVLKRHDLV
jgi:hypothetical protein